MHREFVNMITIFREAELLMENGQNGGGNKFPTMLNIIAMSISFGIQTSSKFPPEYYAFIEPVERCPFLQVEGSEAVM